MRQILVTFLLNIFFFCGGQTLSTFDQAELFFNDSVIKAKKIGRVTLDTYYLIQKNNGKVKRSPSSKSDIVFDSLGRAIAQLLYKDYRIRKRPKQTDTIILQERTSITPDSISYSINKAVKTNIYKRIHTWEEITYDNHNRIVRIYSHDYGEWGWGFTPNFSLTYYSYDNKARLIKKVEKRGTFWDRDTINVYWHDETLYTYDATNLLQTQNLLFKSHNIQTTTPCPTIVKYEYINNIPSKVIPILDKCLAGSLESIITVPESDVKPPAGNSKQGARKRTSE